MRTRPLILAVLLATATLPLSLPSMAAEPGHTMAGMGEQQPALDEFMAAMKTMDDAMMKASGPTVDAMFAQMMIAHHQGAIDMAKVELTRGSDDNAKKIAHETIDENAKGIAELQAWLDAHPAK